MTRAVLFASDKGDIPANLAFTNNLSATTDPGVSNDTTQGYSVGSQWINTSTNRIWTAISVAAGAAVWVLDGGGSGFGSQGSPVTRSTAVTLTAADILTGIIISAPAGAINLQLPLATDFDTAIGANAPVGTSFDFSIINTAGAANAPTITTNTGWTITGTGVMSVSQNISGRFRARKTGAGAWTLYRIS